MALSKTKEHMKRMIVASLIVKLLKLIIMSLEQIDAAAAIVYTIGYASWDIELNFAGMGIHYIEDLLSPIEKLKPTVSFENTFPMAIKFAEYEQDLLLNLKCSVNTIKE